MTSRFERRPTSIDGLVSLERRVIGDHRGFLQRLYCADELRSVLGDCRIAQINHTLTVTTGTVRGMHFQHPPHAETKVISCLRGEVFDVAVDLRRGSPTFLRWHGELLSESNRRSLVIPEGFAHGFQTLMPNSELLYLHTAPYDPTAEGALDARDPRLGVQWPLHITEMSARDANHPRLSDDFTGVAL